MTIEKTINKAPEKRVKRTPITVRNVLTVNGKDPEYHYRIVNDEGDRIEQFKAAGYDVVDGSTVTVGDRRVNKATAEGSIAQVSVGGGQKAVVMRIKKEWYEEDQRAKEKNNAEMIDSTRKEALDGTYGKLEINRD